MALPSRIERANDLVQETLARLIQSDVQDQRVNLVTITRVSLSPDLKHAKVYFRVIGDDPKQRDDAQKGLIRARNFLRHLVAKNTDLRVTPDLRFIYDDVGEKAQKLEDLIAKAIEKDKKLKPKD